MGHFARATLNFGTDLRSYREAGSGPDQPLYQTRHHCEEVRRSIPITCVVIDAATYSHSYVLVMILRLRQLCCHPYLILVRLASWERI